MDFKTITSPNFGERADGAKPSLIIIHYTGMETGKAALERLCDPASKVSAHFFIGEAGAVLNLVKHDKRAWHAGRSYWRGETDINSHSIGIELVNKGHEFGYEEFSEAQIRSLVDLCREMMRKYNIPADGVLAHSDVAPGRKLDPGEKFPWQALARKGIGLWPDPQPQDFDAKGDFDEWLLAYGYNPEAGAQERLYAFYQHFYPEKAGDPQHVPPPDKESHARLSALLRAAGLAKT